ncbi:histidine--tRNA ligase, partial [Candidatus Woesearchaeota archaeon]|nr:histidine--tRNA ligase [Candidatus Woesearchaeota archaeon]
ARGTRDFAAGEALLRQQTVNTLRNVFELYGYNPLETPVLERFDTLASKYAGGAEILKETFTLKDQGDRELALRYDLTVPMCRFIATNPNLKMPFKRYQIGSVFRDGPLKIGRYREFAQCDVDIVGVTSMAADAEMIEIAQEVFRRLRLNAILKVNSRKILNGIIALAGITPDKAEKTILTLDKLEKTGRQAVEKELAESGTPAAAIKKLMALVTVDGTNNEKLARLGKELKDEGKEGIAEISEMLGNIQNAKNVEFDPSLARGLAYYTGTVFEAFLNEQNLTEIKSAIAAGGRYDKMIGNFVGNGRNYPAVGISFGLDIIQDALGMLKTGPKKSAASVYVIPVKVNAKKAVSELRKAGINTDVDMNDRDIRKNLEYASSMGISFVAIIGERELSDNKITLRDLRSGEERLLSIEEAIAFLKPTQAS